MTKNGIKGLTIELDTPLRRRILLLRGAKEAETGETVSMVEIIRDAITEKYNRDIGGNRG